MPSTSKISSKFSLEQTLQTGAAALGLALTAHQKQALLKYLELLQRWNSTYNLTAVRDPQEQLKLHVLDCLTVVPWFLARAPKQVLDVGSGAGLPGLVLALLLPDTQVHVVDKVAKKTAFVTQCKGVLGLANLAVHTTRVEQLSQLLAPPAAPFVKQAEKLSAPGFETGADGRFDVITSRAFASLNDFIQCTQALLTQDGVWAAMKGALPEAEMATLPGLVRVEAVLPLQVPGLNAQRHLVVLRREVKNEGNRSVGNAQEV